MIDKKYLLNSKQMANFVTDGYLRFDELVSTELNQAAHQEMQDRKVETGQAGVRFNQVWSDPLYDHQATHIVNAQNRSGQIWHADAIIDMRMHFDIQFYYFCHDTPREMGGTAILPGSHFRLISETDVARYQNFVGQVPTICKAGTVIVVHHGIWHCAQPNHTEETRYMFKLRLNPTVRQLRLWNTDDLDDSAIHGIIGRHHRWYGNEVRLEQVNRIKFWRFLIGDDKFDHAYWMSRLENMPENILDVA